MDVKCYQLMRCIICYANPISITIAKIQARKGLILYSITNGITALKTCLYRPLYDCKNIWRSYNLLKFEFHERKLVKKRPHVNGYIVSNIFVAKRFI
jgi:hypothetical protein